jgi:hypothetical protein
VMVGALAGVRAALWLEPPQPAARPIAAPMATIAMPAPSLRTMPPPARRPPIGIA